MGSIQVTLRRQRTVEEKIVTTVSASSPEDAAAACQHLVEGSVIDWKFARTVETSEPSVEMKEVNPK